MISKSLLDHDKDHYKMQMLKNEAFQFDQWDLLKNHYKHLSVFKEDLEGPLLKSLRFFK